ncbi:MAG: GIY-YIG nuclease family protein [Candidatus Omnitrophica bacterium]|nr:GIY-YIG nuclease family protein [Candidatus Omnitrophota bacterium]
MHYLYILKSEQSGRYYIGETNDIERRLVQHQRGKTSFGKRNKEVKLVFKKEFKDRSEAKRLECFLKKQRSHLFLDKFISGEITIPR